MRSFVDCSRSNNLGSKKLLGYGVGALALGVGVVCSQQNNLDAQDTNALTFTWGSDSFGQLGHGDDTGVQIPTLIEDIKDEQIVHVDAKGHSTGVLTAEGDVYTFGCGMHSRLGHGHGFQQDNENLPRKITDMEPCVDVSIGEYHGAAITNDGKLYTWGRHLNGMLGHNNAKKGRPNYVLGDLQNKKVIKASCGMKHTAAVTEDGKLFTWGLGREGALGHGNKESISEPKQVEALDGVVIVDVSCGSDTTLALSQDGKVYACGANDRGQLGIGKSGRYQRLPKILKRIPEAVVQVDVGEFHAVALTESGKVYSWGLGQDGQTGHGGNSDTTIPKVIESLKDKRVVQIAAGGGHTACVTDTEEVYMFGRGRKGQLGQGDQLASVAASRNVPVKVNFFDKDKILEIACGKNHTIALVTQNVAE